MRTGEADYYAAHRFAGSGPGAIAAHYTAILGDPWSAQHRRNLAGFLIEAGRMEEAEHQIAVVQRITPRSKIMVRVNLNPETR